MFKIGQKVVCIKEPLSKSIIKGNVYTIKNIHYDSKGELGYIIEESSPKKQNAIAFSYWRFEPLKYDLISNKDLIKEMIIEKSDLPIKEPVLN